MKRPLHLLLIILLVLAGFVPIAVSATQEAVRAAISAEAKQGGYQLITIDELWEQYRENDPDLVLVDTRQEWEYASGHITGARHFSMEPTRLARLTQRGALEQFLGDDKGKTFVFY